MTPSHSASEPAVSARYAKLDAALGWLTELPAVVLLVVEIAILLAGVIARYGFDAPLTWTDELSTLVLIWLAMLGAVVALRRGTHMRLTLFASLLQPTALAWLQTLASGVVIVFLLMFIGPAYQHCMTQLMVTTPDLEISYAFQGAALAVGAALMLISAVCDVWRHATVRQVLGVAVLLLLVALGGWLLKPVFAGLGQYNLLIFFVVLLGFCVAIGVPIAFSFGIATIAYLALCTGKPLSIVAGRMDEGMSSLILLAVPLFVFLGGLIEMTGMARAMINFLLSLLGHVRGGLEYVLLGSIYLVSGISGSKAADMAAVAPALMKEMRERGARDADLVALLSASCAMSETIPPSLVLITMGSVTGVSIAALFKGGLLPALVGMVALSVVVFFQTRSTSSAQHQLETRQAETQQAEKPRASRAEIARSFVIALPALALPFLIRTLVVEGVATATEVSTIGIVYAMLIGLFVYRRFDWRRVYPILVDTVALSGAILLIVGCATAMALALTQSGLSIRLVQAMTSIPGGKWGFMAVSVLAFIVLGSLLEGIPAIVLFGPMLFPVARIAGIDEVHYGMVIVFAMGLGLFAPPFGVGFYTACAIGRTAPERVIGRVWLHLGALLVALIVIAAVPWLSTGLVN